MKGFVLYVAMWSFSEDITEPDSQTEGSKTDNSAERKLSDCALAATHCFVSFLLACCTLYVRLC